MNPGLHRGFPGASWQAFPMTLVFKIDWSAEATSVTIVDVAARNTVAEGQSRHALATTIVENADQWWSAFVDASRIALDGLAVLNLTVDDIRLIELAGNEPAGGLVAFNNSGEVCAALSSDHAESNDDAEWLVTQCSGGAEQWNALTGVVPTAGSTAALLSWLHRSAPEAWSSLHSFTLPIGYLATRLGGTPSLSMSTASGSCVVDRESGSWCTSLLELIDPQRDCNDAVPPIASAATPIGALRSDAADALGLPVGRPLHVGNPIGA